MPPGILLLIVILTVWNPVSLAVQAASALSDINSRSVLSITFLAARFLGTGVGLAAGTALWMKRPGAVQLAKVSLVVLAIEAAVRLSTRVDLGSAPPGTRLPLAIFIVAHNAGWYLYLHLSRRVRAIYGLESQSQN